MAELWSDYTDVVIANLDRALGNKYKISVRNLLTTPLKYASVPNISSTAQNLKEEADKFIDTMLEGLEDQKRELDDAIAKADAITTQLSQNISLQAKQNRIPIITPVLIDRDEARDEAIYINEVDTSLLSLVEKLVLSSTYIADYTTDYDGKRVGDWLFSNNGAKNYAIRAYVPRNDVLTIEATRNELDALFENAQNAVKK